MAGVALGHAGVGTGRPRVLWLAGFDKPGWERCGKSRCFSAPS